MESWGWLILLFAVVFLIIGIVSSIYINKASRDNELASETASAIRVITIMNGILTAVLGIMAYIYIGQSQAFFIPYTMFIVHVALLLGIISISITSIQKLNSGEAARPTTTPPTTCTGK
jgi:hypothetical protein